MLPVALEEQGAVAGWRLFDAAAISGISGKPLMHISYTGARRIDGIATDSIRLVWKDKTRTCSSIGLRAEHRVRRARAA